MNILSAVQDLLRRTDRLNRPPDRDAARRAELSRLSDAELLQLVQLDDESPTTAAFESPAIRALEDQLLAAEAERRARPPRPPVMLPEPGNVESVAVRTVETPLELPIEAPALVASAPAAVAEQRARVERVVVPIPPLTCPGCGLNVSPGPGCCARSVPPTPSAC